MPLPQDPRQTAPCSLRRGKGPEGVAVVLEPPNTGNGTKDGGEVKLQMRGVMLDTITLLCGAVTSRETTQIGTSAAMTAFHERVQPIFHQTLRRGESKYAKVLGQRGSKYADAEPLYPHG